ncbi:MAG: DUF362 domain-containing protein [Candidatus Bathyarchaeia archaeon]|nr:DUF362 domain-containing protein [Candidatus Bathyarchaeia archaeon]
MPSNSVGEVFILKTSNRAIGIKQLLSQFGLDEYSEKRVALKANFNSPDAFPASTHPDTLRAIMKTLKGANVNDVTLAERSGMGNARQVLEHTGVFELSEKLGFKAVVLDELAREEWVKISRNGTHWLKGFFIARPFLDADKVVQTCCLKTHRFGGHFTLSLKNSVGLVAKKLPGTIYDFMWELHGSPFQRLMIAEINKHYRADLIVMDGIKAFISGGPEKGELVEPNLLLASEDRVAIDAVGVAILRIYGANQHIGTGSIFELDQLRRAAELGIGVESASEICLTPLNDESRGFAEKIERELRTE